MRWREKRDELVDAFSRPCSGSTPRASASRCTSLRSCGPCMKVSVWVSHSSTGTAAASRKPAPPEIAADRAPRD